MAVFPFFFFANIGQQNVLYDNLKRKNSKNWYSSKWVNYSWFFLGNIGQENVFCDILEEKKNISML